MLFLIFVYLFIYYDFFFLICGDIIFINVYFGLV